MPVGESPVGRTQLTYLVQLIATLLIIALVSGNVLKLGALLLVWAASFKRLSAAEVVMVAIACIFFTAMNAVTLTQGIFTFSEPDFLGMPYYEVTMWGFYLLHTRRILGGPAPRSVGVLVWALAAAYALSFAVISEPQALLMVTAALLAIGLWCHHERGDLAYVTYMILLGALIEHVGVWSGEWSYPRLEPGAVPVWFITLWGGVGFFLRRLVLPYVARFERTAPETT